jgi:hypothetical protein
MLKSEQGDDARYAAFAVSEMARVHREDLATNRMEIITSLENLVKNGDGCVHIYNALEELDAVEAVPALLLSSDQNARDAAEAILRKTGKQVIPEPEVAQGLHPLRKARVGDWVLYAVETKTPILSTIHESKQTVTAVTETGITVETISIIDDKEIKSPPETIGFSELPKLMRPTQASTLREVPLGKEELVVRGSKIVTQCVEFDADQDKQKCKTKTWINTERVPIFGLVKYESESGAVKLHMELKDFGWGN